MSRELACEWLGRVGYAEGERLQESVRAEVRTASGPERLILLEHPPVYTVGRNADQTEILASSEALAAKGIEVHECNRGGGVTFHGPGQLVGYPIVDLSPDRRDVRRYVEDLESVLVRTLAEYGIAARGRPMPETGVWVGEEKIAAIGIHLRRWVTTHGFALNVDTDLRHFEGIVPCGLEGVRMTSIEPLLPTGQPVPRLEEVAGRVIRHFADVFDRSPIEASTLVTT